jgi:NDP-sugar pyrophosphorylase family protein
MRSYQLLTTGKTMTNTLGMILSAGFGTRLHPLTLIRPKPVMEVGAKPILYFLIRMLERAGIKDIIINLHHQPEFIRDFVAKNRFTATIHLVHEETILGTAGGVTNALLKLKLEPKTMVVMHGDILCDMDLAPFVDSPNFCTLICEKKRHIEGYQGGVGVQSDGLVIELGKYYQAPGRTIERGFFTGIQVLSAQAVAMLKYSTEESLVAQVYPRWLKAGFAIKGLMMPIPYEDLGSLQRIYDANMSVVKNPSGFSHINFLEDFSELGHEVYGGSGVSIHNEAILKGPLMIAKDAQIGKAILGPNVIVGERCCISDGAIIKNSVVMSDTIIEKIESIDCVLALGSARVLVKGL